MPNPSSLLLNNQLTLGWDVGGAHLKAALLDANGTALQVVQVACPLWKGIDRLTAAIHEILDKLDQYPPQHAVTMTGELADIFPDRKSGVLQIADVMSEQLVGKTGFYAGERSFVALADVVFNADAIASANWLASASFVGSVISDAILVDIGSTTTDIVPIEAGKPVPRGMNDAERMRYQELVYTGVVRTPLMAITDRLPFKGEWYSLAAEHFSTAADVYRLTGELDALSDMADTADGSGKSVAETVQRLARMIGCDAADAALPDWIQLARAVRQRQLQTLSEAILRKISSHPSAVSATFAGAGAGSFLVRSLAQQFGAHYVDIHELIQGINAETKRWAAICLPAYAVAWLAVRP